MQISLFLALLAAIGIQLEAQSTADSLPVACAPNQFECNCGDPRCVPQNANGDGVADCADASDELGRAGWEEFCGDGTKARRNKVKIGINGEEATRRPRFCAKKRTRNCPVELGQICLEVNSHPRCVCRLGYFRPPRIPACIPIETFPHFDAPNWVDLASEFKSGRLNCSRLISDLSNLYPGIFLYRKGQGKGIGKEEDGLEKDGEMIARDEPREEMPTDEGDEMPNLPPKFMRDKIMNEEPEVRCDPKKRESCGIDRICAAIGNGTDGNVRGKCVVPIDECAEPALNDCHKDARCMDNDYGFECLCPEGFIDTSPNPNEMPGRNCRKLVNECLNPLQNDCSQNAECQDEPLGFICQCKVGFVDVGNGKRSGRNCVKGEELDECTLGTADCDEKAICEDLTHGFRCRCPPGFFDNSPDPQNRPGRLCFPSSPEAEEYEGIQGGWD